MFHKSKLHASIPGYEYATAIELIAVTSHISKEEYDLILVLKIILKRWLKLDSHQTIEAHLPQLIPLDYIDHIYMTQKYMNYSIKNTRKVIQNVLKIVSQSRQTN